MKPLLLTITLLAALAQLSFAAAAPAVIFTQEVSAFRADGSRVPALQLNPQTLPEMRRLDFDLGRQRLLRIATNLDPARAPELHTVAAIVRRAYDYIETATGRQLQRGVLLYLIELETVPYAYRFSAGYEDASRWSEVRLALVERGAPLLGDSAAPGLASLLYDVLPHELGHDLLDAIPQLQHDIYGRASNRTRWFIEGVCELLAKGFSRSAAPDLHRRLLAQRNVTTVLAGDPMRRDLLDWAQESSHGMARESDLYGAAFLTLSAWTESLPLPQLLSRLQQHAGPVRGAELRRLLQSTSGADIDTLLQRAHRHGQTLLAADRSRPSRNS